MKEERPPFFKAADAVVYVLIAALFAVIMIQCVLASSKPVSGIAVELKGARVYTYEFGRGGKIANGASVVERAENGAVVVTVFTDENRSGYNVIVIDPSAKTALVREADCSFSGACTHMKRISDGGGVIVCVPHALVVRALEKNFCFEPSVG